MGIKRIQREPPPRPIPHLSLIRPLLSLCLPHHHQSSDQSGREWPTGLHRGSADLLRAHGVLGPKSFQCKLILCIEPSERALPWMRAPAFCQMHKDNLVISSESPYVHTAGGSLRWEACIFVCAVDVLILILQHFISFLKAADTPAQSLL